MIRYFLFLLPVLLNAQTYTTNLLVEVTDSCEVAYHTYVDDQTLQRIYNGELITEDDLKHDSIGIDSFQLIRLYWYTQDSVKQYYPKEEKVYIKPRVLMLDNYKGN